MFAFSLNFFENLLHTYCIQYPVSTLAILLHTSNTVQIHDTFPFFLHAITYSVIFYYFYLLITFSLTTLYCITYLGACPWRKTDSPSLSSHQSCIVLHLEKNSSDISPSVVPCQRVLPLCWSFLPVITMLRFS